MTIQKRKLSKDEISREQQIKNIMDDVKERQSSYYNRLY
ncbi:TPA: YrzI family small protein [Bacillus mycoides]|nr:YrzI family small protein [Bacillus mycoides]